MVLLDDSLQADVAELASFNHSLRRPSRAHLQRQPAAAELAHSEDEEQARPRRGGKRLTRPSAGERQRAQDLVETRSTDCAQQSTPARPAAPAPHAQPQCQSPGGPNRGRDAGVRHEWQEQRVVQRFMVCEVDRQKAHGSRAGGDPSQDKPGYACPARGPEGPPRAPSSDAQGEAEMSPQRDERHGSDELLGRDHGQPDLGRGKGP